MKRHAVRWLPVLLAATLSGPAIAAAPAETGDAYTEALIALTARLWSARALAEGCGDEFPETRADRAADYAAWRTLHKPVLDEVEHRMERLGSVLYKPEENFAQKQRDGFQDLKKHLVTGLRAQGKLVDSCTRYAGMMAGPAFDVERAMAAQLSTVRGVKVD